MGPASWGDRGNRTSACHLYRPFHGTGGTRVCSWSELWSRRNHVRRPAARRRVGSRRGGHDREPDTQPHETCRRALRSIRDANHLGTTAQVSTRNPVRCLVCAARPPIPEHAAARRLTLCAQGRTSARRHRRGLIGRPAAAPTGQRRTPAHEQGRTPVASRARARRSSNSRAVRRRRSRARSWGASDRQS